MNDTADNSVSLHLAELLDQHLLGNTGDGAFKVREAQNASTEEMKQDHQLPSALQ